jgi:hypothetical protein
LTHACSIGVDRLSAVTFFAVGVGALAIANEASMLVKLGLVEQRLQAVLEVLNDGASVTDVARRFG